MTEKQKAVKIEKEVDVPMAHTPAWLATIASPAELFRQASDVAGVCKQIVLKTAITIKGRKYVKVEGWEAIAAAHGFVAGARDVERTETGYRAVGELRRIGDGCLIAQAEGFVGDDEPMWSGDENNKGRNEYAIRAMAQTRAISRVCRSAFAHVVVLISEDLSTTPAEEMPMDGKHSPFRAYEEEKVEGDPKSMDDLLQLSTWLKEQKIPEGFVLAMLKEKKLVAANLSKLGSAPPGVIRRTLQSRERLLKAFEASNVAPAKPEKPKSYAGNGVGLGEEDQTPPGMRTLAQTDISAIDLLTQEGYEDWRPIVIPFGKQKGAQLGKITPKSLKWWIENWHPNPEYKAKWTNEELILDAGLYMAQLELRTQEGGD